MVSQLRRSSRASSSIEMVFCHSIMHDSEFCGIFPTVQDLLILQGLSDGEKISTELKSMLGELMGKMICSGSLGISDGR